MAHDGPRDAADVVRALEEIERRLVELGDGSERESMSRELASIRDTLRRLRAETVAPPQDDEVRH